MAAIGPRDTKPEMLVRRALYAAGLRYRLHGKDLPGKPDIVLKRQGSVVFVHGCFWHHHGCANSVWPRVRKEFWRQKIGANMRRDRTNAQRLRKLGWRVFVVWECRAHEQRSLSNLARKLRTSKGAT